MENPKVSVLMPVYNGERYLQEAIDSIINQTMPDFEFIIILDPSDDNSKNIIENYSDARIILVNNDVKQGLARSLNQGLLMARGKYVARMDADDISLPERLAKQFDYMERNPAISISGTSVKTIGSRAGMVINHTSDPEMIRAFMLFQPHLTHPSVIMRRTLIDYYNLAYDPAYAKAEDYKLWSIYSRDFPLSNLREVLLFYRLHTNNTQKLDFAEHQKFAGLVRLEELSRLGIAVTDQEFALHQALSILRFESCASFAADSWQWLNKLEKANQASHYYPEPAFSRSLQYLWFVVSKVCRIANP